MESIKKYIKDNTVKGYYLLFKLKNNQDIKFVTTEDELKKIKEWYVSEEKQYNYLTNNNRYIKLNKGNIIEFSFNSITNRNTIINTIKYIFNYPIHNRVNWLGYVKSLFLAPFSLTCYLIYQKYILGVDLQSILSNTVMLNNILGKVITVVSVFYIFYYISYFVLRIVGNIDNKIYIYDVNNKIAVNEYASFNFIMILFLAYLLETTVFF